MDDWERQVIDMKSAFYMSNFKIAREGKFVCVKISSYGFLKKLLKAHIQIVMKKVKLIHVFITIGIEMA